MNKFVCATFLVLAVFTIFIQQGGAIECWECNSAHDPRCGEFNFDNHTLGVIDCSQLEREHLKSIKPKFCRKIIQKIGETTRVIRGCGWLDDSKASKECYTRTGTKDVMVTFCQCDFDKCNSGSNLKATLVFTFLVSLATSMKLF